MHTGSQTQGTSRPSTDIVKGGLYDETIRLRSRIQQANYRLADVLTRLRGPIPNEGCDAQSKPAELPPMLDVLRDSHSEISELEEQLNGLSALISG